MTAEVAPKHNHRREAGDKNPGLVESSSVTICVTKALLTAPKQIQFGFAAALA